VGIRGASLISALQNITCLGYETGQAPNRCPTRVCPGEIVLRVLARDFGVTGPSARQCLECPTLRNCAWDSFQVRAYLKSDDLSGKILNQTTMAARVGPENCMSDNAIPRI
jgi:hypothetical protein